MFRRASFLSDLILAARALLPARASRRAVMLTAFALAGCAEMPVARAPRTAADGVLRRIAFGSCAKESRKQPVWDAVVDANPELFVFLGDNVYGDTEDMAVLAGKYAKLAAQPGFRKLKRQAGIVATWDDHDYGADDVGREYPMKRESKKLFLDFFGEPAESPRRLRDGGIYASYIFGPPGRQVQILLLDCRWDRTEVLFVDEKEKARRRAENRGYRKANPDPAARMLGDDQWVWLEAELSKPAELRIVGTSTPFAMEFTGTETWANFPLEKERMIRLIERTRAQGVVFVSGDTHWCEISKKTDGVPYPIWDITSSGLNRAARRIRVNRYRIGEAVARHNFGLLTIDWDGPKPVVHAETRGIDGKTIHAQTIDLRTLAFS